MEGKRGGHVGRGGKTPDSKGSDNDNDDGEEGPDGYRYKPDGLMKQSFSITTSAGQHLHLISYYARSHPAAQGLKQPSTDPALSHIRPQKGLYPESSVNDQQNLPAVTTGPMPGAGYSVAPMTLPPFARPGAVPPQYLPPPYPWAPNTAIAVPYGAQYLPPMPNNAPPQYLYAQPAETRYISPFPPVPQPPQPLHPHQQPPTTQQQQHIQQQQSQQHASHLTPQPGGSPAQSQIRTTTPSHQQHSPQMVPPPSLAAIKTSEMITPGTAGVPSISSMMNGVPPPAPPTSSTVQTTVAPASPGMHSANGNTPQFVANGTADGHLSVHVTSVSPTPVVSTPGSAVTTAAAAAATAVASAPPGAQDIPSEKIGFREDERALRQLDRVFI
ncbi:hypothetical protein KEM54_002284 [Ascosphaera aggregata]|nr:hypothetical protein KEM54_002284 [Ascosphaera aggregata]